MRLLGSLVVSRLCACPVLLVCCRPDEHSVGAEADIHCRLGLAASLGFCSLVSGTTDLGRLSILIFS